VEESGALVVREEYSKWKWEECRREREEQHSRVAVVGCAGE